VRYLARRVLHLAIIVVVVTFLVSAMLTLLPGDAAVTIAGENATPEQVEAVRQELNLDDSLITRYGAWLSDAVRGDLGTSLTNRQDVLGTIAGRLPVTIELVVLAQLVALTFAFTTTLLAVRRPGGVVDRATESVSMMLISVPQFVLAVVLVLVFALQLSWFDVSGFTRLTDDPAANLKSVVLPVIAIAADPAGVYQRLLRTDLGRTMSEPFIQTARAKGIRPSRVVIRHALRPSLFSLTTVAAMTTARLIGGSLVVESIFALPGIGRLLLDSINHRDYVTLQGVVAFIAVGYVVVNTLTDLFYSALDPRVRTA